MVGEKLQLRAKMRDSYLIQRLRAPQTGRLAALGAAFAFGGGLKNGGLSEEAMGLLRGIFSFDYMGSAEFEWGAVPAALRFIAEEASKGRVAAGTVTPNEGEEIYFVAPVSYEEEVRKRVATLRKNEHSWQKKEYCGLQRYFEEDDDYAKRNVGWLEIDNGYAFFVDEEMFNKFCKLMGVALPVR
jgi:hypothetical protein